jgi:hypothetical protein
MTMRRALGALAAALVFVPISARADDGNDSYASFALIVGVNKSIDTDVAQLRYADDDASRYLDLFRSLGARSYVLTRPDANTQRLYPQVAAEALLPIRADFDRATALLAADVQQARQRGVKTVLYFVYAGHGNVKEARGYLALEDARLDANELETQVLARIHADQTHFIVDACYSYFLTLERGPGGSRHDIHGFSQFGGLARKDNVGLLLSTSSARESHEWSGVESGVFSHEVRSGLYGAADADGNGKVSYREMAAFIDRANGSIANDRYRPDVYAHPPKGTDDLIDLRNNSHPRIQVPASLGGHYFLEDSRGIRFADFHNDAHQSTYLLKPSNAGRLYLHRVGDEAEFLIPTGADAVSLADLTPQEPRNRTRGAANDTFQTLFALPFSERVVSGFALQPWTPTSPEGRSAPLPAWRLYTGFGLLGASAATAIAASANALYTNDLRSSSEGASPERIAQINDQIRTRNAWTTVGFTAAGVTAVSGLAILLWPRSAPPPPVDVNAGPGAAFLNYRGSF